jgi:trigger factor
MKVQIENTGPFGKKISFEIPSDVVSQQIETTYRTLNRNVKLKGFRPGKVPRSILERHYKNQVENEVISKLIEDSYEKAVAEHQLYPVSPPTLIDRTFEMGKDFTYTLSVEVKPEISVEGYLGLQVEKPTFEVSEEEVEHQLRMLQDTHAQLKPLETQRPVQEKDFVLIDFVGMLDGRPLEGWNVQNHMVEAGSKTLVGELDVHLVGLSVNQEKEIPVTLPASYPKVELAGKSIQVHVTVKEIKEKILPPLDDEFAKDVGEFKNLAELKDRLRNSLAEQKQAQENQAAKENLLHLLREKHPFQVPSSMIDRQVDTLIARTELQLSRQGLKIDEVSRDQAKLRESFRPRAEKEVRDSLILEKIAEREHLAVSDPELDERLGQMAAQLNQRAEALKSYYQKEDRLENLRALMLEEKTLDFLLSKATITEKRETSPSKTGETRVEENE